MKLENLKGILRVLLIYDIMCQWAKWFLERVEESEYLALQEGLVILKAIGDFHVKGHVRACTPEYGLTFTEGIGIIDGEIMETLWSVLNESSRSTRGATLAHRAEILDDHMNHSNWKKLVGTGKQSDFLAKCLLIYQSVSTLIRKWKRALQIHEASEEAFNSLSATADPEYIALWQEGAAEAQRNRHENVKAMDYFLVKEYPGKLLELGYFIILIGMKLPVEPKCS